MEDNQKTLSSEEELAQLRTLAFKDELTQLFNRRYFNDRMAQEFSRAKRYGRNLSLLMMDVDFFKSVNDTFGHAAGDEVLKHVGLILNRAVRDVDMVFRFGGDEFMILLPETSSEWGFQVAQRIVEFAKKETVYFEGVAINFTMSVGMANFPLHGSTEKELMENADAALYQCKLKGRSRAQLFNPAENEQVNVEVKETDFYKIGREGDLKLLEASFQAIKLNHGKTVAVIGDEGSGKSTLVKSFYGVIQKSSRVFYFQFNCTDSGLTSPYLPIKEAISKVMSTQYGQIIQSIVGKMSFVHQYELARLIPSLQIKVPENNYSQSDEFALFDAVRTLLQELSKIQPIVFFIDDFHRADSSTIELVQYLSRNLVDNRIMFVLTIMRVYVSNTSFSNQPIQSFLVSIKRDVDFLQINLSNLSESFTHKTISAQLAPHKVAIHILNKLYELTQGNPLFINETLRYLKEKQILKEVNGSWLLNAERIEFPPTISEMIQKITEKASPKLIDLINIASVIGTEFSFESISTLAALPTDETVSLLDELIQLKIIEDLSDKVEESYRFSHSIVREVFYQEMSAIKKRHIHRDYASYIEQKNSENIYTVYELLADHYFYGKDLDKALEYSILSGDKSRDYYANKSALVFYQRALQIIDGKLEKKLSNTQLLSKKLEVLVKIAYLKDQLLDYSGLRDVLDQIHPILSQIENESLYVHYQLLEGLFYYGESNFEECLKWINLAISGFKHLKEPAYESLAIRTLGNIYHRKADYEKALLKYSESKSVSEKNNDLRGEIKSSVNIALVYIYQGLYEEALENLNTTVKKSKLIQDSRTEAVAIGSIAMVYQHVGNYEKAIEFYSNSIDILYKIDDLENLAIHLANIANTYYDLLEYGDAVSNFEKAIEVADQLDHPFIKVALENDYTRMLIESNDLERANEYIQNSIKMSEEHQLTNDLLLAHHNQAKWYIAKGDYAEAEIVSSKVQRIASQTQNIEDGLPEIWLTHFDILTQLNKKSEAKQYLEKAYEHIMFIAGNIKNEAFRTSYLNKIKLNARVIDLMETEY